MVFRLIIQNMQMYHSQDWMNTEKYRMDEFVRPITSLDFNWGIVLKLSFWIL